MWGRLLLPGGQTRGHREGAAGPADAADGGEPRPPQPLPHHAGPVRRHGRCRGRLQSSDWSRPGHHVAWHGSTPGRLGLNQSEMSWHIRLCHKDTAKFSFREQLGSLSCVFMAISELELTRLTAGCRHVSPPDDGAAHPAHDDHHQCRHEPGVRPDCDPPPPPPHLPAAALPRSGLRSDLRSGLRPGLVPPAWLRVSPRPDRLPRLSSLPALPALSALSAAAPADPPARALQPLQPAKHQLLPLPPAPLQRRWVLPLSKIEKTQNKFLSSSATHPANNNPLSPLPRLQPQWTGGLQSLHLPSSPGVWRRRAHADVSPLRECYQLQSLHWPGDKPEQVLRICQFR